MLYDELNELTLKDVLDAYFDMVDYDYAEYEYDEAVYCE